MLTGQWSFKHLRENIKEDQIDVWKLNKSVFIKETRWIVVIELASLIFWWHIDAAKKISIPKEEVSKVWYSVNNFGRLIWYRKMRNKL